MFEEFPGTFIDNRYYVLDILGRGGQGAVFKVKDPQGELRAVKVVVFNPETDSDKLQRVSAEYSVLSKLSHPNIVKVYEAGRLKADQSYIVMEYINGSTLADQIEKAAGPLPFPRLLKILLEIARGLECAHQANVIHRDLKPANILLTAEDNVKLLDFGLARDMELGHTITKPGETIGTSQYMSPEQLTRAVTLDARTDIYSFGILAFQMATGKVPFKDGLHHEIALSHLTKPLPEIKNDSYKLPDWFKSFVQVCTEKKRDERYQSITEAKIFLERRMFNLGLAAEPKPVEPPWLSTLGRLVWGAIRS